MNKMIPEYNRKIHRGPRDPVAIMQDLMMAGYDEVFFLVGSDRVQAMQFLHKYNGNDKDFSFRKLEIMSSGARDADGDTFSISGTKMRRAAFAGDFKAFRLGIPNLSDQDCAKMMAEISLNLPKNFK